MKKRIQIPSNEDILKTEIKIIRGRVKEAEEKINSLLAQGWQIGSGLAMNELSVGMVLVRNFK
jgi:hypothetical protein